MTARSDFRISDIVRLNIRAEAARYGLNQGDLAEKKSIADVDLWKSADALSTAAHLLRYLYQEVARLNLVVDRLSAVSGGAK